MAIGRINATLTGVQPGGLAKIVPTSVAVGSGSGSVNSNGTITFSGASSISINGCFSSSYDYYRVILNGIIITSDQAIFWRLRANGTDASSSSYYYGGNARSYTGSGTTTGLGTIAGGATSQFYVTGFSTASDRAGTMDIINPFLAKETNYNTLGFNPSDGFHVSGVHAVSTSYDGFSFYPAANTITGTVRVYGYN